MHTIHMFHGTRHTSVQTQTRAYLLELNVTALLSDPTGQPMRRRTPRVVIGERRRDESLETTHLGGPPGVRGPAWTATTCTPAPALSSAGPRARPAPLPPPRYVALSTSKGTNQPLNCQASTEGKRRAVLWSQEAV